MSTCVRFHLSLVVALLLTLLAACGGSAAEPISEAAAPQQATAAPAEPTALPEEALADTSAPAAEQPTEPPAAAATEAPADAPTALPTEALPADAPAGALPLEVVGYGFGVGELGAGWGLVVTNPNAAYALEDSRYTLTVFDAAGNAIHTEEGVLPLLLPGQALGVGGALLVGDEEAVAALEVVVQTGAFVAAATGPTITAEEVTFVDGTFSDEVTGTLVNPYAVELTDLRVSAVAFDAAGNIIGGGTTILAALPDGSRAAVAVPVTVGSLPAHVDLFAAVAELPQ